MSDAGTDHDRGIALYESGDFQGALAACDAALAKGQASAKLHYSRANALAMLKRPDDAIAAYGACLALDPAHVSARYNRATVQAGLQRWASALADLDRTLELSPSLADAWNNRAGVLQAMGRHDEALASIGQVLRLRPGDASASYNAGTMLLALNRFEEAVQAFERTLYLNPNHADAAGCLGSAVLRACDWPRLEKLTPPLLAAVAEERIVLPPLALLAISDDPLLQRRCSEINLRRSLAGTPLAQGVVEPLWKGEVYRHERLRIGYVSSDFRDHPVAHQLVGLLESHDRDRFEILGFANGRADNGVMRQRIRKACDSFHDIGERGSLEAAQRIRALEVDVLVDLNGQTLGWRPAIFKYRPAPVSATYLGYAGTTGADFIDYVIGDPQVTPFELAPGMSEKIVQLPHSFWPADPALPEPAQLSRAEAGLPEDAFVFCCFNANHKIRPDQFACWMRLVQAVPNSILWIRGGEPAMEARFLDEAGASGTDRSRILFARREESFARHLGRMRQADLFLDTFPYNAHVTASDALWAGLPVVTLQGRSFASRVAAGFLVTLGLDELITSRLEDYEALALSMAENPERLGAIRRRQWRARQDRPLFHVRALARDLEQAYREMVMHAQNGPRSFLVSQAAS
jgi:predicted O-linked N-acetylglucosamine transferase (SPINDLY family)